MRRPTILLVDDEPMLLSLFAASNHLPEDDALRALFDRFLLRCHVDNLRREEMPRLLAEGWELEQAAQIRSSVSAGDLRSLAGQVYRVDLNTGQRTFWKSMEPADSAGIDTIGRVMLSADDKSYVYSYVRTLSDLYLVEGLK